MGDRAVEFAVGSYGPRVIYGVRVEEMVPR